MLPHRLVRKEEEGDEEEEEEEEEGDGAKREQRTTSNLKDLYRNCFHTRIRRYKDVYSPMTHNCALDFVLVTVQSFKSTQQLQA